jgi:outer membrane lipoprotein-sorting protein
MQRNARTFALLTAAGLVALQSTRAQEAVDPDPMRMEQLLKLWEHNLARVKTLDSKLRRIDRGPGGMQEEFEGRVLFRSPDLALVDSAKVVDNGQRPAIVPRERIVCTGREVWVYQQAVKQITIEPQNFLMPLRADELKRRYEITLVSEDQDSLSVKVVPRLPLGQQNLSYAIIQLDRRLHLIPTRILLTAPDGKSTQEFSFSEIKVNVPISSENFTVRTLPGWVVLNPGQAGAPQPAPIPNEKGRVP